jgi:hypothetical protein
MSALLMAMAADPSGTTQIVVAALAGGGISAVAAAVITALSSRRKLGAEATKIITDAAAGVVTNLNSELARQRKDNDELMTENGEQRDQIKHLVEEHENLLEQYRRVLQLHAAWDALAVAKLGEANIADFPPVPPLMPPVRPPAGGARQG